MPRSGAILRDLGYAEDTITRVQALNRKKNFPDDPASRVLEDALCLVFLEHQFADLASKTDAEKMIGVLKSWSKMTPRGCASGTRAVVYPGAGMSSPARSRAVADLKVVRSLF